MDDREALLEVPERYAGTNGNPAVSPQTGPLLSVVRNTI
jgi:hypothetical protein